MFVSSLLLASSASASIITGGGIDQARACSTVNCSFGTETFQLDTAADVSGTINLDAGALTLDFVFVALTFSVNETTAGTEDNGVAKVTFSSTTYSGSVGVFEPVTGTFIVNGGSVASVVGDQSQFDDGGGQVNPGATAFAAGSARLTGNCLLVGSALNCGLTFGSTDFVLGVGDPGSGQSPQSRYFQHTANIVALPESVPEPSTMLMMGLSLAVVGLVGRRS